ncbi:MAG TPA: Asp-tRNA(Asn)/Glu-tRNA(Gln) amidotransferase subunit GatB [Gemmataceae bacterium]|nr:Asp-tRNA(Asn)/Glu-tRNA(Gln) amidotransferase subunit GatB [Gemmataceae bacterium]
MADLPYRIVIGLEVHVQLLTRTKLFCGCKNQFGLPPNSATCPVCAGLPGVLPVMNRHAFELALKAALALNCHIAPFTKWDRKNYYYPDLPKNYQISQYDLPFSRDGWLEIETAAGPKRVGIIRVHLEEDAGKMLHDEHGTGKDSLVDLNRAGTPLLEIVSKPELASPEEAKTYLEEIRLLMRELEVSDCEMQEGSLRCDANVNIHVPLTPSPSTPLLQRGERGWGEGIAATPIVEVKNLNSFRAVERAMKFEAQRQYDEFQSKIGKDWHLLPPKDPASPLRRVGERRGAELVPVPKATAGWNEDRGRTEVQRRKEEASDYRYFPEPDLVPVEVDEAWLERIRASLGELPAAQRRRLREQYGLSAYDADVITRQGRAFVRYFEEVARQSGDAKAASNWLTNQVLATLNERKISINDFPIAAAALAELLKQVQATGLNMQRAREVYAEMLASGASAAEAIGKLGFKVEADEARLREAVRRAIAANPKAVADFKKGKVKAADAIKGAVMRETKGMAKIEVVQQLLMEELQKK